MKGADVVQFKIAKDQIQHNWVIYRVGGEPEQHAHFSKLNACKKLDKLIHSGVYPYSPWFQEACRLLLTDGELACLKKPKDRYHNSPRR